jgi:hypothetical protein
MAVTGLVAARTVFLEERVVSGLSVHFLKTPTCDRSIRARCWRRKSADDESAMAGCPWGFGASVRLYQTVEGHDQSLEPSIWEAFQEVPAEQGKTVNELAAEIEQNRTGGLSAAIRVYIVDYYRAVISGRRH